jgi:hypothetical protein
VAAFDVAWRKANPEKVRAKSAKYEASLRQHAALCQLQTTLAAIRKVAASA